MKQTQWHSSKGNSCCQMTLTKQKLLLEILYTLYMATKTSRIPRKAKRFFGGEIFCLEYPSTRSEKGNVYFANYRFSFRKLQIFISQTTDFHFANYTFPFRFVLFRFANYSKPYKLHYDGHVENLQLHCPPSKNSRYFQFRFSVKPTERSKLEGGEPDGRVYYAYCYCKGG